MSRIRKLAAPVCALGISAASLAGFAGGAMADGPHGYGRGFDGHRPMHAPPPPHHGHHGHRHGGGNGAAVALGIGALFVGAMIAAEANRRHADRPDRYDE